MLIALALIGVGIPALVWGADAVIIGATGLAGRARIPTVLVGALVLGFGTSLPEMVVAARAALAGSLDLVVGTIAGSNVANLTLVVGVAALLAAVPGDRTARRVLLPMALGSTAALWLLVADGGLSRANGVVLATAMVAAVGVLVARGQGGTDEVALDVPDRWSPVVARLVAGGAGVVIGAELVVIGAVRTATVLGVGHGLIGMTLVALGTSLPELATAVAAARRNQVGLLVGNVAGSNVFNALAVGAVAGLAGPGRLVDPGLVHAGLGLACVVTIGLWLALRRAVLGPRVALVALTTWAVMVLALV